MSGLSMPLLDINASPFASVLGTNHIPSTAELQSLQALLVHPCHELSRLEKEIDRVQTTLLDLLSAKRIVVDYIEAHRALISPVRQIPPETLAEIFVHCLPDSSYSYPVRDLNQAPLILTIICRDWRRIALSTPQLWNTLHVYLPPLLGIDTCSQRIAGIELWLNRSGSLPLSISFHGSTSNPRNPISHTEEAEVAQKNMESMIRSLMSFSGRFRRIFWSLSAKDFTTLDKLSPSLFPALIAFRVRDADIPPGVVNMRIPGVSQDMPGSQFAPLLSRMPVLRLLNINMFYVRGKDYHSLPCNWKNLTNLAIDDILPPGQVIAILGETPKMQSISFLVQLTVDDIPSTVVHLDDLSEMRLSVFPIRLPMTPDTTIIAEIFGNRVNSLINCIRCPALRLLSFTSEWGPNLIVSTWPFTGFPMHALETLHLTLPIAPGAITECLSQTPNLTTFQFTSLWPRFPLEDPHLSSLTLSPDNPVPMWPRLQNIQVLSHSRPAFSLLHLGSTPVPFSSAALTTFLRSRSQSLKSCTVFYHTKPEPSFSEVELDTLRNLKRDGLKLRIQYKVQSLNYHDAADEGLRRRMGSPPSVASNVVSTVVIV